MSKTIDERVVSMQFDNAQFEKNVSTSMSTLDKLKKSLNLEGASKGLENINSATKGFDISPMNNGVETVRAKFSALEVMAVTALANITNSAVNAGKRLVSAFTIEPIKSGMQEYETQINAVQTILSNTRSKGTTLDNVNAALDELNTYADKTIYNFTEMTRNIGTFTAAGVDLDTSVQAIKGIANLAAVSGSTSQQASTAMYQLSQALASGTVKLMDWNSVVNAGMGGQVFQDALKETARVHGIAIDDMIDKEGSFRETLQNGWLTSEILTETLSKFTGDLTEEQIKSMGYTDEQAKAIMALGEDANNAATKVKTFTQLMDTLKEAAQSGWTQSWEILIGDFEEAKTLWTNVSDYFGEAINKSAEARNNLLQGWKDLGGRDAVIESMKNAFNGLLNILKPIKEAFRDVFPPMTAEKLFAITEKVRDLTTSFREFTERNSDKIKSTFKGIFSIIDVGITVVKDLVGGFISLLGNFSGFGDGILSATGSLGDWISKLRDSMKETDLFGKAIDKVTGFISKIVKAVKDFGASIKGPNFDSFTSFLKSLSGFAKNIGSGIVTAFSSIGAGISKLFGDGNFFEVLNNGLFAGILLYVGKFVKNKGILDDVRGCFRAYQDQLKAGTLLKIAAAIGILAASLFVISTIDTDSLGSSLGGITVLFSELVGSLAIFNKIGSNLKGVTKTITMMIGMSVAILILSGSMKRLSGLDWGELAKGGAGILGLTVILVTAAKVMDSNYKSITKFAGQTLVMSAAIGILTLVGKQLSGMSWGELAKGGAGILGLTVILVTAAKVMDSNYKSITKFAGQTLVMSAAIGILTLVGKQLSGMSWGELAKGGAGILGLTVILVTAAKVMDSNYKSITKFAGQMILMAASLAILTPVLKSLGKMSVGELAKGLGTVAVALAEFAIGLNFMKGTLSGSAALLIAVAALALLTPVLKSLGKMSVGDIAKSLITIAGAFTIFGIAGHLLGPIVPIILGLAAAFALFGLSMVGIGAGLTLIGMGLTSIAAAGAAAATSLVASIAIIVTGLLGLIPTIMGKLGETITAFCTLIGECAPQIAEAVLKLISSVLESLAKYAPQMADSLISLFVGLLDVLAERMTELSGSLVNFVIALINNLASHISEIIDAGVNLASSIIQGMVNVLGPIIETVIGPILEILKNMIVGIVEATSSAIESICNAFISLVSQIAPIINSITTLVKQLGDSVSQILESAADVISTCGDAISQVFQSVADVISTCGETIRNVLEGIAETINSVFSGISEVITSIGDSIQSVLEGIAGVIDSIGEAALNAGTGFENLANGVKTITELNLVDMGVSMAAVAKGIKDIASNSEGLAAAGAGMQQIANGTNLSSSAFNSMAMGIKIVTASLSMIGSIASSTMSLLVSSVMSAAPRFTTAFMSMITSSSRTIAANAQAFFTAGTLLMAKLAMGVRDGAGNISTTVSMTVAKCVSSLGSGQQAFYQAGITLMTRLQIGIVSGGSAISSAITTVLSMSVGSITKGSAMFQQAGVLLTTRMRAGITSGSNGVRTAVNLIVTTSLKLITGRQQAFYQAGSSLMSRLRSGITTGSSGIRSTISSVLAGCVSTMNSYYGGFYNAGVHVVNGFANGISANTFRAEAKARAMAESALKAARRALRERSPSKAFYEVGDYAGQGFVNAFEDFESKSFKAGFKMANSATDGLGKALSKITDIVDSEDDIQPTIRPVLDMSSIDSGTIDLGASITSWISSPIASLSQMMAESQAAIDASNQRVVDAVNGLREDLNNLYSSDDQEIALYVDSKKLATSLAKPMNRQLNILSKRGAY